MGSTPEPVRLEVTSQDGTPLAVWVTGSGPPLVLVHGSLYDHRRLDLLVAELRDQVTTFAMDRRGFGGSGDAGAYSIAREFEDVAAVVTAAVRHTDQPAALFGHSYGASCAMGGARLSPDTTHLVLYEPSLGLTYPPGSVDGVERALAAGDREAAVRLVFVDVLGMSEDELDEMRAAPEWPMRLACAPTVPRECRAEEGWVYRPDEFAGVTARTLVLAGSETVESVKETTRLAVQALPAVRVHALEGHGHMAHRTHPQLVASAILDFIGS